jgi:hypothetical protein
MLLIPGKRLSILRAVWNFNTFGFSKIPSIGVRKVRFQIQAKTPNHRRSKEGDSKIAAHVDDIGNNGEGSA